MIDKFLLNNDLNIPSIGFGTWKLPDGTEAVEVIRNALSLTGGGYNYLDTAAAYVNEASIGDGIMASGRDREELFISGKLWNTKRGYAKALKAFKGSLKRLQLTYLDLYLIHWPASDCEYQDWKELNLDTWKALEELYSEGLVKAIGVCNFLPRHLDPILEYGRIKPMINQIEFHPGYLQPETVSYCRQNKILVEAWSPLGNGKLLTHPVLEETASLYHKTVAQICIRWCLQNNILPITKTSHIERMRQNRDVFNFEISEEDMDKIGGIQACAESGMYPDKINKFV